MGKQTLVITEAIELLSAADAADVAIAKDLIKDDPYRYMTDNGDYYDDVLDVLVSDIVKERARLNAIISGDSRLVLGVDVYSRMEDMDDTENGKIWVDREDNEINVELWCEANIEPNGIYLVDEDSVNETRDGIIQHNTDMAIANMVEGAL